MPRMQICVSHDLGADEATNRLKRLSTTLVEENQSILSDIHESWIDHTAHFSFRIMGFSIEGSLYVEDSQMRLEGKFPLAALPFKKGIEKDIRNAARKLMDVSA